MDVTAAFTKDFGLIPIRRKMCTRFCLASILIQLREMTDKCLLP